MSNRPAIPVKIRREVLIECGHRCAIDGVILTLELAHIIPWRESREHKAVDLICLCANCHTLVHIGKLDEATLREYKRKPWVLRQFEKMDGISEPKTKVVLKIEIELRDFDEKIQGWIQYGIAGFLGISAKAVRITLVEEDSVKVTVELPRQSAEKLLSAHKRNDPKLAEYLYPLDLSKTDKILATYQAEAGSLIPVLQDVQAEYGYVPEAAMEWIAVALNIPASKVYGVVTFYAQFHTRPQGRNLLRVCCGTACHVQGGEQILENIKQTLQLHPNDTTSDGKFTLQEVACLGCCGLAPVLMLNENVYGKLTKDKAEEIIHSAK